MSSFGPWIGCLIASSVAAQVTVDQFASRELTRVVFFERDAHRQIVIQYGQPRWREEYERFVRSNDARHIRLGRDFWTTLHTNVDFRIGATEVRAGHWYVGARRTAEGEWQLTLMASAKVDAAGLQSGATDRVDPDIAIPMKFSVVELSRELLSMRLARDPKELDRATLSLHWGRYRLAAELVADVDVAPLKGLPEFAKPRAGRRTTTASGLVYEELTPGAGAAPGPDDEVEVHYTGWLDDGSMFDSSLRAGQPIKLRLPQVIKGWQEGLQLMQPGAEFVLSIPPELGYGRAGAGTAVPPNATLIFRVQLLRVTRD